MSKTSKTETGGKSPIVVAVIVVVVGIALFAASGYGWWHSVRSDPETTLYGAINNNFRVHSVSRDVVQDNPPQKVTQQVALNVSPQTAAQSKTKISQTGTIDASVETETVSNRTEEFVRYLDISTTQKNSKGEQLNFDELLNIWGKTSSEMTGQPGQTYGEAVLGVIPTGNFNARDRQALMDIVRKENVYSFDEATLLKTTENGRPVYVYDVKVEPIGYIKLLQKYGSLAGLPQLAQLDPQQYEGAEPLSFKLKIDVWSQRLAGIEYAGATRVEQLNSYGVHRDIQLPKDAIPVEELQAKLQQAQQ